jgi:DNA ligase-1
MDTMGTMNNMDNMDNIRIDDICLSNNLDVKVFDKLFGKDVNGKVKEWSVKVFYKEKYSIIEIIYGYTGGKMVESTRRINYGKNIGKSNETTHFEQAVSEAFSKWKNKTKQGFAVAQNENVKNENEKNETKKTIKKCDVNSVSNIVTFPMLANDFSKHKKKIKYPVYVQPKLDGYRMLFNTKTKFCNSRQGKEFTTIRNTNLYKELLQINEDIILDGELYIHNAVFENLGILRKIRLSNSDLEKLNQIEYHVYDFVNENLDYKSRLEYLKNFFQTKNFQRIRFVETEIVESETDLKKLHHSFVERCYEGSIVRTVSGKYRCKARSQDLLKFKDFTDSEYKIVGFTHEQDTAYNKDLIIWICINENGDKFNVRPKGTREERNKLYQRGNEFIGQLLHVKYFELTEGKIPRFPTTKSETYETYIRNTIE